MDFFEYVNKDFIESNPIPEHQVSWGHFYILREKNYAKLLHYLKTPENQLKKLESKYHNHFLQMCNLYKSFEQMTCETNTQNITSLFDYINTNMMNKENSTIHNFLNVCSYLQKIGINVPIQSHCSIDFKCNKRYLLCVGDGSGGGSGSGSSSNKSCNGSGMGNICSHCNFCMCHRTIESNFAGGSDVGGGGISLPDKSFYTEKSVENDKILNEYRKFILKFCDTFRFSSEVPDTIIQIETDIAHILIDNEKKIQPTEIYNLYTLKEFKKTFPSVPAELFTFLFLKNEKSEIWIQYPDYLKNIHRIIWKYSKEQWSNFFKWKVVMWVCPYLFNDIYFDFFGKTIRGQIYPKNKDEIYLANTIDFYGHMLGEIFRREMFDDDFQKKNLLNKMICNIKCAFKERLQKNEWMNFETKKKAIKKLENIKWKLGGIALNDYNAENMKKVLPNIICDPNDLISNLIKCNQWIHENMISNHKECIDNKEWFMYSFEVNAYYSPENNEMVFPIGILQAPFFDIHNSIEQNYGSIGCIIGHELTHAFDNNGSKYNENGELFEWWKPSDKKKFLEKKKSFNKIFSEYIIHNVPLNVELTCGENIADAFGVRISFNACLREKNKKFVDVKKMKTFFKSYAYSFCVYRRKELEILLLKSDPHSPPKVRVNAILNNFEPFMYIFFGFLINSLTGKDCENQYFLETDFLMNVSNEIEIW